MKKIFLQTIAAVAALMAIFILSACGAKDETPIPADAAASAAPEGTAAPAVSVPLFQRHSSAGAVLPADAVLLP